MNKDTYCSYCSTKFSEQILWPRNCFRCHNVTYKNPVPVAVMLVPVKSKLISGYTWLIEQRGIEPKKDGWAFPSGYIDFGETWQEAAVRELREEVGIESNVDNLQLFDIANSVYGSLCIYAVHSIIDEEQIKFVPNEEVLAISLVSAPVELCFPGHNEMWKKLLDNSYGLFDWASK